MDKKIIASFTILLLFLGPTIIPQACSTSTSFVIKNDETTILPEDEGDHFPCGYECWCYQAIITLSNGQRWDAAATFVYFMNKTQNGFSDGISFIRVRHWSRQTGKVYDSFRTDIFPGPFQTSKNEMNLTYCNSSAHGLYPDYYFHCEDDKNNIITDLRFHAASVPCWGFQGPTDGVIPWGFSGTGKVYFIPILEVNGTITINGTTYEATGIGYYEHDFLYGDFARPLSIYSLKEFNTCRKLISSSIRWYLLQVIKNRPNPRPAPILQIDNGDTFGWSWSWMIFDNNWSIVLFRPILLGISEGLNPMILYLTKDGKNYSEIACGYWRNNQIKYMERADIFIPLSFNISAYKDDMEIQISFTPTTEMTEKYNKDWAPFAKAETVTFYCCGNVKAEYRDKNNTILLNGSYTIEQSRGLSKSLKRTGYRSLEIVTVKPPDGLSISIRKVSSRLGFERFLKIQLRPNFEFIFYVKPIS
jgi:hypothetical protein